jgi:hypothetical protein
MDRQNGEEKEGQQGKTDHVELASLVLRLASCPSCPSMFPLLGREGDMDRQDARREAVTDRPDLWNGGWRGLWALAIPI